MLVFFVYILVFSNGKFYVGMSRTDKKGLYTNRFRQHLNAARGGRKSALYDAWRECGDPEQFVFSEHEDRASCAISERAAITVTQATNPNFGYNIGAGGEGQHAPKGSAIHRVMQSKVWGNAERNAKVSAALKGRAPSPETIAAYRAWMENGGLELKAEAARQQMAQPGARERAAENARKQMAAPGAKERLSEIHTGRADPRSPEGKRRALEKQAEFKASPEGKAAARRGYEGFAANPQNVANNRAALDNWRASEANAGNCKRMAALSAKACRRPVRDERTGVVYPSQRDMAKALGVSDPEISRRIKRGTAARVDIDAI